jgi:hypothetical protein
MESLTLIEILGLLNNNLERMNDQFENWLTITFATIVAAFAARNRLTKQMKYLVTGLYLLATFTCASTYYAFVMSNIGFSDLAMNLGREPSVPWVAGAARISLVVLGVITTIYFIHKSDIEGST